MTQGSGGRFGGTAAILLGVSYVVVGITYLLLPELQRDPDASYARFLASVAQNSTPLMVQYWAFALGAVLGIAVVPAISETVRTMHEGWVRWTTNLAFLGFAVTAVDFFRQIAVLPERVAAFNAGSNLVFTRGPLTALDPDGWLGFGAVGLWAMGVSVLALRGGRLPRTLSYVGVAVGLAYWLVVLGLLLEFEQLLLLAAIAGGVVLAPTWYVWFGLILRRS